MSLSIHRFINSVEPCYKRDELLHIGFIVKLSRPVYLLREIQAVKTNFQSEFCIKFIPFISLKRLMGSLFLCKYLCLSSSASWRSLFAHWRRSADCIFFRPNQFMKNMCSSVAHLYHDLYQLFLFKVYNYVTILAFKLLPLFGLSSAYYIKSALFKVL